MENETGEKNMIKKKKLLKFRMELLSHFNGGLP